MDFEINRPHSDEEIDYFMAVAVGRMIGYEFASASKAEGYIFAPAEEALGEAGIEGAAELFTQKSGEPFSFVGMIDETEALLKAKRMRADNCRHVADLN